MTQTTFQTVVLEPGKHRCPEDGACVVELASMLAREPFTDRPRSVCRVIAAFLRPYNDCADDRRRQELYRCAADIVGTRGTEAVERRRIARCDAVFDEFTVRALNGLWRRRVRSRMSPGRLRRLVAVEPLRDIHLDQFGVALAYHLHRHGDAGHERALALVDELVAIGPEHHPDRVMRLGPAGGSMVRSPILAHEPKEQP
jgi:hypothetical protein